MKIIHNYLLSSLTRITINISSTMPKTKPSNKEFYIDEIKSKFQRDYLDLHFQEPLKKGDLKFVKEKAWALSHVLTGFESYDLPENLKNELIIILQGLTFITIRIENHEKKLVERVENFKKRLENRTVHLYDCIKVMALVLVVYNLSRVVVAMNREKMELFSPFETISLCTIVVTMIVYLYNKVLAIQYEDVYIQTLNEDEQNEKEILMKVIGVRVKEIICICEKNHSSLQNLQHTSKICYA